MNTIENHPTAILPAVFARDADRFTQITWKIVKVLSMALTILLPLTWVVQFAGLILKYLTFGLYLILYSLILWMPTMGLLLGTSCCGSDTGHYGPFYLFLESSWHWWGTLF